MVVLLCRRHHRAVHEEGFRVTRDAAGGVQFLRPDGRPLTAAPPAPVWAESALEPTNARLVAAGIGIDARTATPAWQGNGWTWAGRSACCGGQGPSGRWNEPHRGRTPAVASRERRANCDSAREPASVHPARSATTAADWLAPRDESAIDVATSPVRLRRGVGAITATAAGTSRSVPSPRAGTVDRPSRGRGWKRCCRESWEQAPASGHRGRPAFVPDSGRPALAPCTI